MYNFTARAIVVFALFAPLCTAAEPPSITLSDEPITTIRPPAETLSKQGLPQFVGISGSNAGATGISMNLVIIPPGAQAEAHLHLNHESAIYLLQGRVETRYGKNLEKSMINQAGDFIFIPANVPHQPRNLSDTEAAVAVVARDDPNEQESVLPYAPSKTDKRIRSDGNHTPR